MVNQIDHFIPVSLHAYSRLFPSTPIPAYFPPLLFPPISLHSYSRPCPVFGNEKRSLQMPIQISTLVSAHNSLWVGTENGVLLTYPFTTPSMVAEESGWELIKVRTAKFGDLVQSSTWLHTLILSHVTGYPNTHMSSLPSTV